MNLRMKIQSLFDMHAVVCQLKKSNISEDFSYQKYLYQYLRSRKFYLGYGMITNTCMYSGRHYYGLLNFVVWWNVLVFRRKYNTKLQGKHGGSTTVFQLRPFIVKFKLLTFSAFSIYLLSNIHL